MDFYDDRQYYTDIIYSNLFQDLYELLGYSDDIVEEFYSQYKIERWVIRRYMYLHRCKFSDQHASAIKALWNNSGIQTWFRKPTRLSWNDPDG